MKIEIRTATPEECYRVSVLIPEFSDGRYPLSEYEKRTKDRRFIGLIAEADGQTAGFKIGYETEEPGVFYSWMGGVLPAFRKFGVAKSLAHEQEAILYDHAFSRVRFKTRNYLKPMLIFALKNGFNLVGIESMPHVSDNRILLEKQLN